MISDRIETLSLSCSDISCKQIDTNAKNLAKELNFSQYDEVMEKGLGFCKKLEDTLFKIDDSDSEESIKNNETVSQIMDSTVKNYQINCSLSYNAKRTGSKRKIFKAKKNRLQHFKETYNDRIQKMAVDKRNSTTQKKVEKIRVYIDNNQLQYDPRKKKNKLIIPFYLKCFSLTKSAQNLIKSCRFYEYVFPLDSELYCSDSGNLKQIFESLKLFKRVYRTEHNTLKKQIKYLVEEKDIALVGKNNEGILKAYGYLCDWLRSLNNAKAKFFSDALIQFKEQIYERLEKVNTMICTISMQQNNSEFNSEYNNSSKFWLRKLDKDTKKWQKKRPYIIKTLRTGQEDEITMVVSVALNYSMFDFLGYTPDAKNHDACLKIMAIFASIKNFKEFLIDQGEQDWNVPNVAKPTKQFKGFTIQYGNKSKQTRSSILFNEIWITKNYHYRRSYWVMSDN